MTLSTLQLLAPAALHAEDAPVATLTKKVNVEEDILASKKDTANYKKPVDLDEIVVTGQGSAIQKRRLSSEVTTVSARELAKSPSGRLDQQLQNLLPNVQVTLTNGQPGTTSMIKARGLSSALSNSTPVIYVDGVRMDNLNTGTTLMNRLTETLLGGNVDGATAASGAISDIPVENIDHIEYVSGGAATTLYGSDAGNGVLQIFTKKGGNGRFSGSAGVEIGFDTPNSQYYYFDRTKDLLNQTGFEEKYRLSFSGGNERSGYSLGASMSRSTGIVIHNNNESKKYELRFGSHLRINRLLEYQNSFGLTAADFRRSRNGNEGTFTGLWVTEGSACAYFTYTDTQGNRQSFNPDIDAASDYEYAQLKAFCDRAEALQNNKESVKRFQTSQQLIFTPLPGLTFKGILGVDYRASGNKIIETNEYLIHTQVKPAGTDDSGSISNFDRTYFGVTADLNGQYKYYRGSWLSNIVTAGFQYFNTRDHQSVYTGKNVRDGAQVMSGAGTLIADEWLTYLHSYGAYVQNNFGLWNRYYLDLGLRMDYNTAFGDNVGWQAYPKIGLSYILSDEPFMHTLVDRGWVTQAKVFANYGIAGTYPPAFAYQKTIAISSFQGKQAGSFGNVGNPDLGPEKKHSYEVGIITSLLHNWISLGATYYYTLTKGALFSIPTLPSSGQSSTYLANVGKIRNRGWELSLGVNFLRTKDWRGTFNASLNTNDNLVLSTGGAVPFGIGGFSARTIQNVVEEGKPLGYLRGSKTTLNADGTIAATEYLQDLGNSMPSCYGNFSLNLSWRKLGLLISGDYQTGSYVHSFDRQFRFARGLKDPDIPAAALTGITQAISWLDFTNFFVEKADFLKIRNISLDYTWDFAHGPIHSLDLGVHCYNPLSFTASSVDPEAILSGALSQGAVATPGLNYATYSAPRQFVVSVNVSF
ncbi:MAG: TonB-dependent receptor [Prevotella sp.]|nr:TonB-dependent receptor [Prevotella sp.]